VTGRVLTAYRRLAVIASRRHYVGRYGWRVGVLWRTWLLGVQWDFQADAWCWHLGPLALRVWRADR
jgi:hypothetical protein